MKNKGIMSALETIAERGIPGDTNLWPRISARIERKSTMLPSRPRTIGAILIAMLSLIVFSGAAYALGSALGYIPGVGLVENRSGIRILAEPVVVTRDGVTLTVASLIAYEDRVEVVYDVKGIGPGTEAASAGEENRNPMDFCGGVEVGSAPSKEGNARLQLPDGTILERDSTGKYAQNVFAMKPVYGASLPSGVTHVTFLLDCIPQARRGAAPEEWAIPLDLKFVPAGTVVGAPVIEVEPQTFTSAPAQQPSPASTVEEAAPVPAPVVTVTLSKIVPLESRVAVYFSMDMENKDPSLVSLMPVSVYVIDSLGQKHQLIGGFSWQPFEHRVGSEFEFVSQTKPADGPLTLVVENAVAYYAPLYVEPRQATPDEMSFTFNVGANPQYGQTWALDETFEIAGYAVKVTSARAGNINDLGPFDLPGDSEGFDYGYDFTVEADPSVKMQTWLDILSESPMCGPGLKDSNLPASSTFHSMPLCKGYPTGNVRVTIMELSVLVENNWRVVWAP